MHKLVSQGILITTEQNPFLISLSILVNHLHIWLKM